MGVETALILGGAAAGLQAFGDVRQGQEANAVANSNANAEQINAEVAAKEAALREQTKRAETRRILSAARARQGASGLAMSGSFLDVQAESARNAELDALTIRYGGKVDQTRSRNEQRLLKASGKNAVTGSYLNAATSLLGGAARLNQ